MIKQTTLSEAVNIQRTQEDETVSTLGKRNGGASQVPKRTTDSANDLDHAVSITREAEDRNVRMGKNDPNNPNNRR
jgi:hypothetical protein